MQFETDEIIKELGIENLSENKQSEILDELDERVGAKISEGLTEQQENEYQAIIDNDERVIDAWLEQNLSDYKESDVYKALVEDPELERDSITPEKIIASIAWVEKNIPNVQDIVKSVAEEYKVELSGEA